MRAFLAFLLLIALSVDAQTVAVPPQDALWDDSGTAAVAAMPPGSSMRIAAFIRKAHGGFLVVDISRAEDLNLGKLGLNVRRRAERIVTTPIGWIPLSDGRYMVTIRTRVWIRGKRHTVTEPVVFDATGTVEWR
jgi:hypothetical protein